MFEKHFTIAQAEELIPKLEQIMENVLQNKKQAVEVGQELSEMQEKMRFGLDKRVEATDLFNKQTELEFLVKIINEGLDSIEAMGAQPKDLNIGLVDFPAMIEGEEVLLCWKYGEKKIRFYHGMTDGYVGRKPLTRS